MDIKVIFMEKSLKVEQRTIAGETIYTMVYPFGAIRVREDVFLAFSKQLVNEKKSKRRPAPKKPAEKPAEKPKEVKSVKKKSKS